MKCLQNYCVKISFKQVRLTFAVFRKVRIINEILCILNFQASTSSRFTLVSGLFTFTYSQQIYLFSCSTNEYVHNIFVG